MLAQTVVRALESRAEQRGQKGYLLMTTLALMLFFMVTVVALLGMTITSVLTTKSRVETSQALRAADSAMEKVISDRRMDMANPGIACPGTTQNLGVPNSFLVDLDPPEGSITFAVVQCTTDDQSSDRREFTLHAYVEDQIYGMTKIRIGDSIDPGAELLVCDWQLGDTSSATPAACP